MLCKLCLEGEGAIDLAVFQEPCSRPSGCQAWGSSRPGPCTGPGDLIVPKHSPYHLIFQCSLHFWPPIFIYAEMLLALHSAPQKMGQVLHLCTRRLGLLSHLSCHHLPQLLSFFMNTVREAQDSGQAPSCSTILFLCGLQKHLTSFCLGLTICKMEIKFHCCMLSIQLKP